MIEVYHWGGARSRRVLWTLEELGVAYEVKPVRFPPKLRDPDFMAINPIGTIPAMRDGAVLLTESLAICEYLAQRHGDGGLVVGPAEAGFADYLQFLHFGESTLGHPIVTIVRYSFGHFKETHGDVADDARAIYCERLEPLARVLADGRPYLAGDRFTLADISVGYSLGTAEPLGVGDRISGPVADYYQRLAARPARQRAYEIP